MSEPDLAGRRAYEIRHTVSFEETNLVGNVYYVNHLRWQGRCREMFLRDHSPGVLARLSADLALVTLRCSCEYLDELGAFDEIAVRMRLAGLSRHRIDLAFEYLVVSPDGGERLAARGEQSVACMLRGPAGLEPCPVPEELRAALEPYG